MLKTPLAMLRRASSCPRLKDLAKRMGCRVQRLNAVEAGRDEASPEFLTRLAKEMGYRPEQVVSAFLEGRNACRPGPGERIENRPARRRDQTAEIGHQIDGLYRGMLGTESIPGIGFGVVEKAGGGTGVSKVVNGTNAISR